MPVVLSQHPYSERYRDVEGVIYNFPSDYFDKIEPFQRFLYYRPSAGAPKREASTYIAHGVLGQIYPTPDVAGLRTVEISAVQYFKDPVPFRDPSGNLYESEFDSPAAFQGRAVRRVGEVDFFRILAAAQLTSSQISSLVDVESSAAQFSGLGRVSPFRTIIQVPPGTGYVPTGRARPDPAETAALQERARGDHQSTLQALIARTLELGGICQMNNNIDLLATVNSQVILFEAKSLTDSNMAVDRMRYGIGQLADYEERYADRVRGGKTALAFANPLGRDESFVAEVLDSKGIGLVIRDGDILRPNNDAASSLAIFR